MLTEAVGTVSAECSCSYRNTAIGISGRMNSVPVAVGVVLVVAQFRYVQINGRMDNNLGNVVIKRDGPLCADAPSLRNRSNRGPVRTPDQDSEYLMRIRLIQVDERWRAVTTSNSSLTGDPTAHRSGFA